jgi:adenosylmethionine-8-amino-7-oxononanoate aminotransferase
MRDWLKSEPIVIMRGSGAELHDVKGHKYLDANSSIWTNLHGHNHPIINKAIRDQLGRIAHSSALGLANGPASVLAEALIDAANQPILRPKMVTIAAKPVSETKKILTESRPLASQRNLAKVFFSDDGSTALEVALKLAFEFCRRTRTKNPRFLSLDGAYHGDTVGAVSLGHIDLFHKAYSPLLFKSDRVMAPYCYRCPFNRANPERADARQYRKCHWECVDQVERKFHSQARKKTSYGAFVVEPSMQGAAGMIPQPMGWLERTCEIARGHGALVISDEVMTGFGRTGASRDLNGTNLRRNFPHASIPLFASHREGVQPDILALAKGLTGGYLPMAATLTSQAVFDVFLGEYADFKTFFHGHSFTGNQIGAAAALASLSILQSPAGIIARLELERALQQELQQLWKHPQVGDIRQVGLVVGVELTRNWRTREAFELRQRAGIRVCEAMARRGVLTRPVGNVIVLMPPYCTTKAQTRKMVAALGESIEEELARSG